MLLCDCLPAQSLRHLEAIHRARGFPFDSHLPKARVVDLLAGHLKEPEAVQTAEARAALVALLEAG